MPEQKFLTTNLLEKKNIAQHVWELRFEKPADFMFKAGQFVQFHIPNGESGTLRSYSISSTPSKNYLEFCVKYRPDGVASEFFDQMTAGQPVEFSGPHGNFVWTPNGGKHYFVATGTGLAPTMAMLESDAAGESELLVGVRSEDDIFWLDRLQSLQARKSNFSFRLTLSQPSESWTGLKGRVIDHLVIDPNGHYYICGKMEMVKDVRRLLIENGLNTKSIHFEIF